MSTQQFNRPREFNPTLQQQIVGASTKKNLRDEFGLEEDETGGDGGGSDNEDEQVPSGGEDYEGLYAKYNELLKSNQAMEAQLQEKNSRIDELQRLSKQSHAILVNKHKDLIKALSEEYEQNKGRWKIAMLESGGDAAKLEQKIKVMDLTKENSSLREQIKELELVAMDLMRDLQVDAKEKAEIKGTTSTTQPPPVKSPKNGVTKGGGDKKTAPRTGTGVPPAKSTGSVSAPVKKTGGGVVEEKGDVAELKKKLKEQEAKIKTLTAQIQQKRKPGEDEGSSGMENIELKLENQKLKEELKKLQSSSNGSVSSGGGGGGASSAELSKANETIAKLKEQLKTASTEENERHRAEKEKLIAEKEAVTQKLESVSKKLQSSNASSKKGREVYSKVKGYNQNLKEDVNFIRATLGKMGNLFTGIVPQVTKAVEDFKKKSAGRLTKMTAKYNDTLAQYKKEAMLRKKYFNTIQELKGNIRVYCRIRPLNDSEKPEDNVVSFPEEGVLTIKNAERKATHSFEFEKIFQPASSQAEVFDDVKDLVVSVLDGYNVCIFAYGQTGSGKTFTMEGPKENPGLYSRTLKRLFEEAGKMTEIEFKMSTSLLEIYNDKLNDLMDSAGDTPLKIVHGDYGNEVADLKKTDVDSEQAVLEVLARGAKNRSTAATKMNERSSRSHLVLSIYVKARNTLTNVEFMGKLHLIDLAGSERVKVSGVTGDRLKEAQEINKSLSCLGNCISARANKTQHVPYRDSTLTFLLQDSLEKNSKTLMFVQISPTATNASESVCSLKFAERVRKVELGKAEKTLVKPSK